jgi:uncharacterized protein (DUF433 family)
MKLTTEKVWRGGNSQHHNAGMCRKREGTGWKLAMIERRVSGEPLEFHKPTFSVIAPIFFDAAKRIPSISINANIMEGQPCIEGTRIPVRSVLRAVELYGSIDGVITCYPHLNQEQVKDALYFAQVVLEQPSGIDESEAVA